MKKTIFILIAIALLSSPLFAQELVHKRLTVSSGGGLSSDGTFNNQVVIGQTAFGAVGDSIFFGGGGFFIDSSGAAGSDCEYVTGDINNSGGLNGLDVTYGVAYFKGSAAPPYSCECTPGNFWYVGGDANASCSFNGLDITYLVSYFKGGNSPNPCADCPPSGIILATQKYKKIEVLTTNHNKAVKKKSEEIRQ